MAQPEFAGECVVLLQGLTDGKAVLSHQLKVTLLVTEQVLGRSPV